MLASVRPCHQLMSRKDMMPTPSHPIKSMKTLLAVVSASIATRKVVR